jgi:DNA polymerase-1
MLAIDTEYTLTSALEPVGRLVCVSWALGDGAITTGCGLFHAVHDAAQARDIIRYGLSTEAVFANAPADIITIWHQWPDLLPEIIDAYEHGRVIDVLTSEKLIDIAEGMLMRRGGYGLKAVASRRAGIELDKGEASGDDEDSAGDHWRLRYEELLPHPLSHWPVDARDYPIRDATSTLAVRFAQLEMRAQYLPFGFDLLEDAPRRARAHLALTMQSLRGIRVDHTQVARVAAALDAEITRHTEACLAHGLARWKGKKNPKLSRNKKAATAMLVDYASRTGQEIRRTAPTEKAIAAAAEDDYGPEPLGNIQLSQEALEALVLPPGHPLDSYRLLGSTQTMRTGWIDPLTSPLGRVYTRYDELKDTGRTGSGGWSRKGPRPDWRAFASRNLQNFPRDGGYRECLIPDEGMSLLVSDYSYAELVALAQVQLDWFGRSSLADVISAGRDPHGEFAGMLLGLPAGEFDKANPQHKQYRQLAKAWNFGKPGAMGQARFIAWARTAYGVTVAPDEERFYTQQWHRQWPEIKQFWDRVRRMEGPGGRTTIIQPRSGRVRGQLRFPEACNSQFQGLAADGALEGVWRLFVASLTPSSALYGYQPLLFVHDENVGQIRSERAAAAKVEKERIMIAAFGQWCPNVPVKVETTVTDRYVK